MRTDRFEIVRRLGEGGFGVVYEALDRERGMRVALKTLTLLDGASLYRFKKEFRVVAGLSHENLIQLYELIASDDDIFYTMALVDGVDWTTYVRGSRPHDRTVSPDAHTLPSPETSPDTVSAEITAAQQLLSPSGPPVNLHCLRSSLDQLVRGLVALHEAGIVHRDIKPSNVLVTKEGRVVVLDFGIAASVSGGAAHSTDRDVICGTPAYMAPEQAAGAAPTPATDWYAVGVMLFQALTDRLPFDGYPLQVIISKQKLDAPRLRDIRSDIPADIDVLCADLLQRDPGARPSDRDLLRRLGLSGGAAASAITSTRQNDSRSAAAIVGRGDAMTALNEIFAGIATGSAATALVIGPSGIGKTTLVEAFLEDVEARHGAAVLKSRCFERETLPFKAFDGAIDALSRLLINLPRQEALATLPRDVVALATAFPVLNRVQPIQEAPRKRAASDAWQIRARAFEALRELFGRLSDRRPIVLFIDDVQWGDADSASLLAELMRPPDAPSLMLILNCRNEDAERSPLLRALESSPFGITGTRPPRRITLAPLSPHEAEELAARLLGLDRPQERLAAVIAAEAAGNPFFVGELARVAGASATSDNAEGVRLENVVRTRVEKLSQPAQTLLNVVCVAQGPLLVDIGLRAIEDSAEQGEQALSSLRAGLLVRSIGASSEARVEPYHDRIREVVVGSLSPDARLAVHQRLVDALTEAGARDAEALFFHCRAAGIRDRAALFAADAGDRAARALAFDRAAWFYQEALQATDAGSQDAQRLRLAMGDALANAGRGGEAAAAYLSALPLPSTSQTIELRRRAAEQLLFAGHVDAGLDATRAVLAQVGMSLAPSRRRALLRFFLLRLWIAIRGLSIRERPAAEVPPEDLFRIDACWSVASGVVGIDTISGVEFGARHLLLALRTGERTRVCRALCLEAGFLAFNGSAYRDRALSLIRRADRLRSADKPNLEALVLGARGMVEFLVGDLRSSVSHFDEAWRIYREHGAGSRWELNTLQIYSIFAIVHLGDLRELRRRLPAAIQDASERGDLFLGTNLRIAEPNIWWLANDDPDGAERVISEALGWWSHRSFHLQHWYEVQGRVNIDLYRGDVAAAARRMDEKWIPLTRSLILRIQASRVVAIDMRARSAIAEAAQRNNSEGRRRAAIRYARQLLNEGRPWSTGLGRVVLGAAAFQRGDMDEAVRALSLAVESFERADMALLANVARRRLGEIRGGDEGRALVSEAGAWFSEHSVRDPARMTAMIAPGFPDS